MKNLFIINPTAGSTRMIESLQQHINEACEDMKADYEIYHTKYAGDCERYIHEVCEKFNTDELRFFGAGGDGTLNEVINAIVGYKNASAGIIPLGTGNDFIRVFGDKKKFLDIKSQLSGIPKTIDLIRCEYEENGEKIIRYCDNMINIGFDSNVVAKAAEIRKKGIVTGSLAYLLGVAVILVKKRGANLRIEIDNGYVYDGPLLLTAAANGMYCGGGVCSSPYSKLDDGIVEFTVIRDVTRRKFISMYPSYSKGTHFKRKDAKKIMDYNTGKKAVIRTNGEKMKISNDGEIVLSDEILLEVEQNKVRFSVPEGI